MNQSLTKTDIAERVESVLRSVSMRASELNQGGSSEWTKAIKRGLTTLGFELEFDVCTSGIGRQRSGKQLLWPEWLYDMTWVKMSDDRGCLKHVPLVLESEWSTDAEAQIEPDFQKLLVARADLRVMIFPSPTAADVRKIMERLKGQVNAFDETKTGDLYLFVGWIGNEQRFEFRLFQWIAPANAN